MPTVPASSASTATRPGWLPALGPEVVAGGTWFRVRSHDADALEVCLPDGGAERRVALARGDDGLWSALVEGVGPGTRYGLRAHGRYAPEEGLFFQPDVLLVDPYARAIDGAHGVVVADPVAAGGGARPLVPWADTVVHELHVRGHTRLHPAVPPSLRGTYAGLAHPAVVDDLRRLGVTAVELLPVHEFATEASVAARGLRNYWGYSTLGYLAPHAGYSASGADGGQVAEFRAMVRTLHAAGIEVLADVVFNHTCEGGPGDPTRAFRGLDNRAWYWLDPERPGRYVDMTGCGNMLDPESPTVQELVLASLRYWYAGLGVDGFRFDLATWLGRRRDGFDMAAPLLRAIAEDPLLEGAKLIAEPWDIGPGGYRVGGFPLPYADWNGAFRDDVRDAWRGHGDLAALARRFAGSEDIYAWTGRNPLASVNFVTAHDGFTLADLVAYDRKRNDANHEGNRDGEEHNRSWGSGCDGPTGDPTVLELRGRRHRGLLATLLLAVGTPMLLAGDERGRTQQGNNNGYCQDGPLTWTDWTLDEARAGLLAYTRRLLELRRTEPLLRRSSFLKDEDVDWLAADGAQMDDAGWHDGGRRALGVHVLGAAYGRPDLLIVVNVGPAPCRFALPTRDGGWSPLIDTARADGAPADGPSLHDGVDVAGWSVAVLRASA